MTGRRPGKGGGQRRAPGFTLVELVVALALLEILMLGAVGLLHLAAAHVARAERTEQAVWTAGAVADSLGTGRGGGAHATRWGWVGPRADHVVAFDSAGRVLVRLPIP